MKKSPASKSKLSIGPLLFNWSADKVRDFYYKIADEAPVDYVYVGEVVCSKRAYGKDYLPDVIERLEKAGKTVIISGLSLIMDDRDAKMDKDNTELAADYLIEANDLSTIGLLSGKDHAIGPFVNIYNEAALNYFEAKGAKRISLPHELSAHSLKALSKAAVSSELEVQVFGRLPLAISARCYHARANNLNKSGCQYVCDRDADGLTVDTTDGVPFLVINGLQTMSYTYCNLMAELKDLTAMGINNFRLSPHDVDMVKISNLYRQCLDGKITASEATLILEDDVFNAEFSNGFYHGKPGLEQVDI